MVRLRLYPKNHFFDFFIFSLDFSILQINGTVRIDVGKESVQFMLAIVDDVIVEGVEELVLNLYGGDVGGADVDPDNVDFEGAVTSVFILDNDGRLF